MLADNDIGGLAALVEVIKAGVWPATVLILVYMLRGVIADLASSVKGGKLKYKDLEIAFARDLQKVKDSVGNQAAAEKVAAEGPVSKDLLSLAKVAPRAAIMEAWMRVETEGAETVRRLALSEVPEGLKSPLRFAEVLRHRGLIRSEQLDAINRLRDIRNRTAHFIHFQPTTEDAEEYVVLAAAVGGDLKDIKKS